MVKASISALGLWRHVEKEAVPVGVSERAGSLVEEAEDMGGVVVLLPDERARVGDGDGEAMVVP